MTLTKAIEAARVLLTAVYQADGNEELAENITGEMMGNLDTALAAMPDKPMTESQIEDMFWEMDEQGNYGDRKSPEETIEALKAANVLYVED